MLRFVAHFFLKIFHFLLAFNQNSSYICINKIKHMITYKKENILTVLSQPTYSILHQVNCLGIMGGGVAKALADNVDGLLSGYKNCIDEIGDVMGGCYIHDINEHQKIYNCFSQYYLGSPSDLVFDFDGHQLYDNFEIRSMALRCVLKGLPIDETYSIPLIASGLAADKVLKGNLSDFEYFQKYIEPILFSFPQLNFEVYYL